MLPIHKNANDPLRQHRSKPDATYDNIPKKDRENLVVSLLLEQHFICAYCTNRIDSKNMSVEHWEPQNPKEKEKKIPRILKKKNKNKNRISSISYKNLLAVCCGNEGHSPSEQHCDTKKGDSSLLYNPASPSHHSRLRIKYAKNGEISSADQDFNAQLSDVLNLNFEDLKERRKNVFDSLCSELAVLPKNSSKASIQRILDRWQTPYSEHKLPPFAGVAIYFLEKRLTSAQ